jgi:hypothetical protein
MFDVSARRLQIIVSELIYKLMLCSYLVFGIEVVPQIRRV